MPIRAAAAQTEKQARPGLSELYKNCPIPSQEQTENLGLFIKRQDLARMLFMHELYKMILPVHGIVIEFGVRWGQNMALFSSLRGIYEPFNYNRRLVGFDTFEGFPEVSEKDGTSNPNIHVGGYSVTKNYHDYLDDLLSYHETQSPIPHIKKYELVKGDVTRTLDEYLERNPQTVIAMAYFDLDIYTPTKYCLDKIRPYLTKGSVLGFDELNHPPFPGETLAVRESIGLENLRLQRLPFCPIPSFAVVE